MDGWLPFVPIFHSPQKKIVDLLPYEGSQTQELSINPMQDCLKEVPLPWIFTVKQLQELQQQTVKRFFTESLI